jgi:hypothetical protein
VIRLRCAGSAKQANRSNFIQGLRCMSKSIFSRIALLVFTAFVVLGCSKGGYQRGLFQGYVVGLTEEEIIAKVGKPDSVDKKDPASPRLIYKEKTFDPDNMNAVDPVTIVRLEKNKEGKMVGVELLF